MGSYLCGIDAEKCLPGNHGAGYPSLQVINFENVDTSQMTSMKDMFRGARSLRNILNLDKFNTSNVTNMESMFEKTPYLQQVDLSSFDTSKVTTMAFMFTNSGLRTIYVSKKWSTAKENGGRYLFTGFDVEKMTYYKSNVIGGNGTICNNTSRTVTAAHIDVAGNPGCLTLKVNN